MRLLHRRLLSYSRYSSERDSASLATKTPDKKARLEDFGRDAVAVEVMAESASIKT
jgi:hypothetical protein